MRKSQKKEDKWKDVVVVAVQFLAESLMQEDDGASSDNIGKTKKDTVNAKLEMSFRRTKM